MKTTFNFKLENTKEKSINPFDLPIGEKYPTDTQKEVLCNLLTLLSTSPIQKETTIEEDLFIEKMIQDVYFMKSINGANPNQYQLGENKIIDNVLNELKNKNISLPRIEKNEKILWLEIADFLIDNNFLLEAEIAQRYVVPKFDDLIECAKLNSEQSKEKSDFIYYMTENLPLYPVFSDVSKFEVSKEKIKDKDIIIDIDEDLLKNESDVAKRMVAVMYVLSKYVLMNDEK